MSAVVYLLRRVRGRALVTAAGALVVAYAADEAIRALPGTRNGPERTLVGLVVRRLAPSLLTRLGNTSSAVG